MMYWPPQPLTYIELLNMALCIEDDQPLIKKSTATRCGFLGRASSRHHGEDRAIFWDQACQGEVKKTIEKDSEVGRPAW